MLKELRLTVRGQSVTGDSINVASGLVEEVNCHFDLDSEWKKFPIVAATFRNKARRIKKTIRLVNGSCKVPWECIISKGDVEVNLEGHTIDDGIITLRMTSFKTVCVRVLQNVFVDGYMPPTPEIWEEVIEELRKEIAKKIDDAPDDGKTYNRMHGEWVEDKNTQHYARRDKLNEYLYDIAYETTDEAYAREYINSRYLGGDPTLINGGGCSAAFLGGVFCKNLDWTYSECVDLRVENTSGKYAYHGMAGGMPALVRGKMDDNPDFYKVLPFLLNDGINSEGLWVGLNVVPGGDTKDGILFSEPTTETNTGIPERTCAIMLPALLLANFATPDEVATALTNRFNIYCPHNDRLNEELHLMFGNSEKQLIAEFINNEVKIIDVTDNHPYMTNFYRFGAEFNEDGTVDYHTLTDHATGVHRHDMISESGADNLASVMNLFANQLKFTNAYRDFDWRDEFCAKYNSFGDLTIAKANEEPESFSAVFEYCKGLFNNRTRDDGNTWQTTHSSFYRDNEMWVVVQEMGVSRAQYFRLSEPNNYLPRYAGIENANKYYYVNSEGQTVFVEGGGGGQEQIDNVTIVRNDEAQLSVKSTDEMKEGDTKPISSNGVFMVVGQINDILKSI